MIPITEILKSDDPLSDTYFESLLNYSEEDALIDYKEQFNIDEEKDWLSITKDIMAFSNTIGGFLVFGVRDITFELIGIDDSTAKILGDANNILQKINRFIEPQITNLRSKKVSDQGKLFVFVYIPASKNITHMFSKDGSFKYPSGQEKCEFRKGTFIVRRSAGNHLADSRDLDFVFNNRLKSFRESILDRISKVVEAPSESKILIVSEEKDATGVQKYTIDDSPDAIPVKGMSFSIVPKTDEEELSGWVSLNKRDPVQYHIKTHCGNGI